MNPKITFVMPTYNSVAYLANSIYSLMEQKEKEIEIIVIDDASTDTTSSMKDYFTKKDSRIRWFTMQERMGAAHCRNLGNRAAQADIICVMDAGDLSHPDRATATLEAFKKYPNIDIISMGVEIINYLGDGIYCETPELYTGKKKPVMSHPTIAYKKSWIIKFPYRETCKETDQYEAMIGTLHREGAKFGVIEDVYVKKMQTENRNMQVAWPYKKAIYEEFGWDIPDFLKGVKSHAQVQK